MAEMNKAELSGTALNGGSHVSPVPAGSNGFGVPLGLQGRGKKLVPTWYEKPRVLYFFLFFLCAAINSRFNSIFFMHGEHLTESQVGMILGLYQVVAMFVGPCWTIYADMFQNSIYPLFVCAVGSTVCFLLYGPASGFVWVLVVRILFSLFFPPLTSLVDSIALKSFSKGAGETKQGKYGLERLWGAVSWAIAHIIIGLSIDAWGAQIILIFAVTNMLAFGAVVWFYTKGKRKAGPDVVKPDGEKKVAGGASGSDESLQRGTNSITIFEKRGTKLKELIARFRAATFEALKKGRGNGSPDRFEHFRPKTIYEIVFRSPLTIAFFCDIIVMGMATSLVEGLVFLFFVNHLHASNTLCGVSVLITVLFEIPIFAFAPRITKSLSTLQMLLIAHVAYIVRAIGYTCIPVDHPWLVLLFEPLHGVTYAFFQMSTVVYCSELANKRMQATAQGLRTAALSIGALIGYVFGSIVMEQYGSHTMYRSAAIVVALAVLVCFYIVRRYDPEAYHVELVEEIVVEVDESTLRIMQQDADKRGVELDSGVMI